MTPAIYRVRAKRTPGRAKRWALWLTVLPTLLLIGALAVTVAAWRAARDPGGQVIARAGGADITRQDVMAEARAQGRPAAAPLTPDLVQAVVARTLLAQEARRRGVQHATSFPSDRRRAMAQVLAAALLRGLPSPAEPTDAERESFIAAHPDRFADRRRLVLDELQYRASGAPELQGLSLEDAEAKLAAAGARYRAFQTTLYGSELPQPLQHALDSGPEGIVAVWRNGELSTAMRVASSELAPVVGVEARLAATRALQAAARERQTKALVAELAARERVKVQPAYAP